MWIFGLTVIILIWIVLTTLCMIWMLNLQQGWMRVAWGAAILLLPGLGSMLWLAYGKDRLRIGSGDHSS